MLYGDNVCTEEYAAAEARRREMLAVDWGEMLVRDGIYTVIEVAQACRPYVGCSAWDSHDENAPGVVTFYPRDAPGHTMII